jgi:hypothetical protein
MKKLTIILLLTSPLILQAMQPSEKAARRRALLQRGAQLAGEMRQNADKTAQHISELPEKQDLPAAPSQEETDVTSYDYLKTWGTRAALLGAGGLAVYFGFPRQVEVIAQEPIVRGKLAMVVLRAGKILVQWAQKHSK